MSNNWTSLSFRSGRLFLQKQKFVSTFWLNFWLEKGEWQQLNLKGTIKGTWKSTIHCFILATFGAGLVTFLDIYRALARYRNKVLHLNAQHLRSFTLTSQWLHVYVKFGCWYIAIVHDVVSQTGSMSTAPGSHSSWTLGALGSCELDSRAIAQSIHFTYAFSNE